MAYISAQSISVFPNERRSSLDIIIDSLSFEEYQGLLQNKQDILLTHTSLNEIDTLNIVSITPLLSENFQKRINTEKYHIVINSAGYFSTENKNKIEDILLKLVTESYLKHNIVNISTIGEDIDILSPYKTNIPILISKLNLAFQRNSEYFNFGKLIEINRTHADEKIILITDGYYNKSEKENPLKNIVLAKKKYIGFYQKNRIINTSIFPIGIGEFIDTTFLSNIVENTVGVDNYSINAIPTSLNKLNTHFRSSRIKLESNSSKYTSAKDYSYSGQKERTNLSYKNLKTESLHSIGIPYRITNLHPILNRIDEGCIVYGTIVYVTTFILLYFFPIIYSRFWFKMNHLKAYKDIKKLIVNKNDPFTLEDFNPDDQLVIVKNEAMLLDSWKHLNKSKKKRNNRYSGFMFGNLKKNIFKVDKEEFKTAYWISLFILCTSVAWMSYELYSYVSYVSYVSYAYEYHSYFYNFVYPSILSFLLYSPFLLDYFIHKRKSGLYPILLAFLITTMASIVLINYVIPFVSIDSIGSFILFYSCFYSIIICLYYCITRISFSRNLPFIIFLSICISILQYSLSMIFFLFEAHSPLVYLFNLVFLSTALGLIYCHLVKTPISLSISLLRKGYEKDVEDHIFTFENDESAVSIGSNINDDFLIKGESEIKSNNISIFYNKGRLNIKCNYENILHNSKILNEDIILDQTILHIKDSTSQIVLNMNRISPYEIMRQSCKKIFAKTYKKIGKPKLAT